jgi:predicted esterase
VQALLVGGLLLLAGCADGERRTEDAAVRPGGSPAAALRIDARPRTEGHRAAAPGTTRVTLRTGEEALVRVPQGYDAARPAALAVLLHGAGGTARSGLDLLSAQADAAGILLVAPSSAGSTWDGVLGAPGPDVEAIDGLLAEVFDRHAVDPGAVAVGGFSDGASYALGLGLANGHLFRHVVALSPGFVAGSGRAGRPRLFVSHGTADRVLPIERCGRPIARRARDDGYDVTYREFEGGHEVPEAVRREAVAWLVDGRG